LIAENTIRTTARAEVFEERFGSGVIAGLVADGVDVTAERNVVEDVHTAVYVQGGLLPSVDVRENDFTGYVVSIEVYGDPVAPGSMTCNWWGDESGPQNPIGAGAGVYTPFATEPIAGTGRGC